MSLRNEYIRAGLCGAVRSDPLGLCGLTAEHDGEHVYDVLRYGGTVGVQSERASRRRVIVDMEPKETM